MAKVNNKNQHSLNGNSTDEDIGLIQLNTANGPAAVSVYKVMDAISSTGAKIIILSESNIATNDPEALTTRANCFENFRFEDKTLPGCSKARISILVHKSLEYGRREDLDNKIRKVNCIT